MSLKLRNITGSGDVTTYFEEENYTGNNKFDIFCHLELGWNFTIFNEVASPSNSVLVYWTFNGLIDHSTYINCIPMSYNVSPQYASSYIG